MRAPDEVIAAIESAFGPVPHPGDALVADARFGGEPGELAAAFAGRHDWRTLDATFLDVHYVALSFFTEAAFRFYLPAYLVADVRRELRTADPVFPLVYGLVDWQVKRQAGGETFEGRQGARTLLNPRRYGAMRHENYARYRLSVFAREEAAAICAYLEWRRDAEEHDRPHIAEAIDVYWRDRAATAPMQAELMAHLAEDARYLAALDRERGRA